MKGFATTAAFLGLCTATAWATGSSPVIVTVESPHGVSAPALSSHDVIARVGNQPVTIAEWHTLREDRAGLELWIMIDDGTDSSIGIQFRDIQNFIRQQPPETKVGIGYLRNGSVQEVEKPTTDHEAAAKALRLPSGIAGISASPYIALSDFLHKKPVPPRPREIVLVSSGIDPYYGPGPENPYLQTAIRDAQRAGVPVSSIYFSSAGHAGHSYWQINWGQNDLSQLSDETGGEFYWQGNSNPVAFKPFLDDLNRRIAGQYVMSLDVNKTHGSFEPLRLHTETPRVTLVGPAQIHTP